MCLFTFNNKTSIRAKIKGIDKFECGHCPECLQKKSRKWALRCGMQAKTTPGVMVTLTYDTYKVINGKLSTIEENPINPNMQLSKRDCQLFIKRLRKHFEPLKIKYLLTAERGKKGRAHYHALLFGVQFDDLIKYKKSDRGNWIYKSKTLTGIWTHGICTVDCINLSAKTARYCTKYCAKDSGANETFMLFSRGIGDEELLKQFNGKSYWVDGREFSIPREIWNKVIEKRYNCKGYSKYVNREHIENVEKWMFNKIKRINKKALKRPNYPSRLLRDKVFNAGAKRLKNSQKNYQEQAYRREWFQYFRDNDKQYMDYIEYWKEKNRVCDFNRPAEDMRILALPESKYRSYKAKAIQAKIIQSTPSIIYKEKLEKYVVPCLDKLGKHNGQVYEIRLLEPHLCNKDFIPPRSDCHAFMKNYLADFRLEKSFAPLSRHYRANDTAQEKFFNERDKIYAEECKKYREWRIRHGIYLGYINSPLQYFEE